MPSWAGVLVCPHTRCGTRLNRTDWNQGIKAPIAEPDSQ